ncbi:MAG: DUF5674 family protein [Patescibacteria group bacterium]
MKFIEETISRKELKNIASANFGSLVKAVVDVEKGVLVVDAELHSDEEAYLLENGSKQQNLWGINLYPDKAGKDFIEFDSMINMRPSHGNQTRGVDDSATRERITRIVEKLIKK